MAKSIVSTVDQFPPGERKVVRVKGRPIVVFNLSGEYFALLNVCPHQRADLSKGVLRGISTAEEPGKPKCSRAGEFLRCPWHGWEFDVRTGKSWTDPDRIAVRQYDVSVESEAEVLAEGLSISKEDVQLVEGPYQAETFPVTIEGKYVVVEV